MKSFATNRNKQSIRCKLNTDNKFYNTFKKTPLNTNENLYNTKTKYTLSMEYDNSIWKIIQ